MIIKSHIRGGYRAAAQYLKEYNKNEQIRLVHISDADAKTLDEAFHNMWTVACNGKSKKPLHHISINPMKDERLTDKQMLKIVERAEQKYGYKPGEHQRVIVEHILNGRQHFHVMWNRVSLKTGKAIWPGEHWKKSKQICREMEKELGLKTPTSRRVKRIRAATASIGGKKATTGKYAALSKPFITANHSVKAPKPLTVQTAETKLPDAIRPVTSTKGWPDAAILAWETWGKKDPVTFFRIWSELASPGFSPRG